MGNFGVGPKKGEVGDYIPGKGYVSYRPDKKKAPEPPPAPPSPPATGADAIQKVLTNVFGTVPRNRLKEAGIDD